MPFFSSQLDGLRLRNSYQVIIVGQHGGDTYIIYNFHEVTWYSGGGNSGGNIHTGQGGQPAMAGFTDGLGSSFELPYSGTNDVIRIDDESNVGMAGRYVFRVNGASIVEPDSPTSPILTCPSSPAPVLNCGSGEFIPATVAWSDPTTVTCLPLTSPISCTPSSPHTFTATTTVSCSASNAVGEGTCTFDVLVNQDTTAPTIICTEDITTQSNNPLGTQVAYSPPMSEDECGVYTSCDLPSNSLFPCGENTVTCTSMDNVGNQNSCSFKITVNCQQLQLTNCPSNIDVVDSMPYGEAVNWDPPTASGHTSLTSNYEPGHVFFGGTFDVVYIATDAAGNELQCTFTITVESDVYGPVSSLCRKYILDTTSKTWNESDTSCQSSGGNLARIVGRKTNNFLITSIQDQGMNPSDIWFGAHRVESSWLYPDDSPVCYSNWASGEDQDGDTCAQLWAQPSGKWTSEDCSLTKRSICELA
ncbi:hyalin-like [Saccoglossus kowalevskii]